VFTNANILRTCLSVTNPPPPIKSEFAWPNCRRIGNSNCRRSGVLIVARQSPLDFGSQYPEKALWDRLGD